MEHMPQKWGDGDESEKTFFPRGTSPDVFTDGMEDTDISKIITSAEDSSFVDIGEPTTEETTGDDETIKRN